MRRIMIISWKWIDFKENIVDEEWLEEAADNDYLESIVEAKGHLFDEYRVCYSKDDEIKVVDPPALVVRTRINNHHTSDQLTMEYLTQLIAHYEALDSKIFVFLHRKDGFTDASISQLINKLNNNRYFLFGDGRDYIYHSTLNQGLLGDDGKFYAQMPNKKQPAIQVADNERKLIFQPHFSKVWDYYEHEFHTKIYELKEDILSHFFPLLSTHGDEPYEDYLGHLEKDPPLSWRVKSFMDSVCQCFESSDKANLEEYGKQEQKSFIFDDCRVNLSRIKSIDKEYEDVVDLLNDLLFDFQNQKPKTLQEVLHQLNKEFEELLASINKN